MNRLIIFFCCLLFASNNKAQRAEPILITKKMISNIDTITTEPLAGDQIYNTKALEDFFKKLKDNENNNNQKINIVHIGDSHIQSDLMTNEIRKNLQKELGNAGRGFIFPYSLARTNGSYNERFRSNKSWECYRNIFPVRDYSIGLSGIALWRNTNGFVIEVNVKDVAYKFNTIKVITPQNQHMFDLATRIQTNMVQTSEKKVITHKIKKGEAISVIADKYNVSIAEIKRANHLKSNAIRAGRTLKIATNETRPKTISQSEYVSLDLETDSFSHYYNTEKALDKIYLIPNKDAKKYELNGLVLEKNASGVIYSSIGVNGSKFSDYNKYPLFFEQVKSLHPDIIVLSLGTNESYEKLDASGYIKQLRQFISNLKEQNIHVPILVMTPPPSLLKGRRPNIYVADYTKHIFETAQTDSFAVWDLFNEFGGLNGVGRLKAEGLIGPDYVHYSKKGYEKQGDLFSKAILKEYDNFKLKK
jgi:LysM repeat protein/lysophospholipase L1-like esterase